MSKTTFNISRGDFVRGLNTALAFAGADGTLPMLCGVELSIRKGRLLFASTDRYRLAFIRVEVTDFEGEQGRIGFIERSAAAKAVQVAKGTRREMSSRLSVGGRLSVTIEDGRLEVGTVDDRFSTRLTSVDFPKVEQILRSAMKADGPVRDWAVNPTHLAAFKVAQWPGCSKSLVRVNDVSKPIFVMIGDHFLGMQMPQRVGDDRPHHEMIEDWGQFLLDDAPVSVEPAAVAL